MTSTPDILWFRDIGLGDRLGVGGKGASLGELARAGIAIPGGFVVTTAAFNAFLENLDPRGEIRAAVAALDADDIDALSRRCEEIRGRIRAAALPGDLRRAVTAACDELGGGEPVAVRSSATSEDSEEASFAGLQDTYLWVRGAEQVLKQLRACWASLYNDESVSYRLRRGIAEEQLAMGVVVQRMVDARCAGVMFTRSPTSGDRSVVCLEGSWGLGSGLVSGEVTPDRYVVNKITGEITRRDVAVKTLAHVPRPEGGVAVEEVPAERQASPCLSDEEIRRLVDCARRVEAHYGCPQDIEWAVARESGDILLLQSRPETVWAARDRAPIASLAARPFDHIFAALGGKRK